MQRTLTIQLDAHASQRVEQMAGITHMALHEVVVAALALYEQTVRGHQRSLRVRKAVEELQSAIKESQGQDAHPRLWLPR